MPKCPPREEVVSFWRLLFKGSVLPDNQVIRLQLWLNALQKPPPPLLLQTHLYLLQRFIFNACVYMSVHACVCMSVHACVHCIRESTCVYMSIHVCIHVHMSVHVYAHVCMRVLCTWVYNACVWTWVYMYTCVHVCLYVCT